MTRRLRIDDLPEFAVPEQPALSPDGEQIVYVLRTSDLEQDANLRSLWRVPADGGRARQLTRGKADTSPAWSPDGTQIAFLRAEDGPAQIWLLPATGGEPEQLTKLPLGAGAPIWSPDGTTLAFGAPVDTSAAADEDDETRERRAKAPVVMDRIDYQADGTGLLRTKRKHLHVVDLGTKNCRQVTEGDWHAGDPAWSPDSTKLAFSAGMAPDADLTFHSGAYFIDIIAEKATPKLVGLAEDVAGPAIWTADGTSLLVVANRNTPTGHAGLLRVPLDGGEITDLSASLDRNVMPGGPAYPGALPVVFEDGAKVLFCVRDRGCSQLYSVALDGGTPELVIGGPGQNVSGASVAGGSAAIVLSTPTSYGEIATIDLSSGAVTVATDHGANLAEIELFPRVEREFTISDGTVVSGWLIRDPLAVTRQPLLLDIHGGPHNAWNGGADEVHLYHQELVAKGWSVLLLNPRASDGYGEEFFTAAVSGWGVADARDFLEPLDELVAEGIADAGRLAVTGYSYGGFMTCYLTSRDDRFAAAVAGGVVSDLTSMAGTSDIGHYLSTLELGGLPWVKPDRYDAMSPIKKVDQVRTPTLVLHGADDVRCPVGQAQQWHTALREQGVPTRLVLYPEASHLFIIEGRPSHRLDFNRRTAEWIERYAD